MFVRFLLPCLAVLSLAACGGDSGSDTVAGPDWGPLTSGVLEGPVTGLRYETGSESGITDESGTFSYRVGQRVRFYVGDILVGDARAAESLTLFNLAGLDSPPVTATEVRTTINQMDALPFATPFEIAANIAALLYTLDEDENTSNGIVIPAAIHNQATGPAINFGERWLSFSKHFPLRKLLADANHAGVWPSGRALLNCAQAMDALYASLGLAPEIYLITTVEIDTDNDGDIDEVITSTFDGNGFLNDDHWDKNNDDNPELGAEFRYDAAGNNTSFSIINDGVREYTHLYSYDALGFLTEIESTYDAGSGIPDKVTYYTPDYYGFASTVSEDSGADGNIDAISHYHYDLAGRLLSVDRDIDNDGGIELRNLYYYNSRGQLARVELDVNSLGVPGEIDTLTRNAYDQNQTIRRDVDADGHDDIVLKFHYNSRQQLIRSTEDYGADGSIERQSSLSYDANGYLVKEKAQATSPSSYNSITAYTRDALGNELTRSLDHDGNGIVDATSTYVYDEKGNLTESIRRLNKNGTIYRRAYYSHQLTSRWGSVLAPPAAPAPP